MVICYSGKLTEKRLSWLKKLKTKFSQVKSKMVRWSSESSVYWSSDLSHQLVNREHYCVYGFEYQENE